MYYEFNAHGVDMGQFYAAAAIVPDGSTRPAPGVPLEAVVIGPGRAVTDLHYDWTRAREVEEDGVVLVRPDKHIGWRATRLPADPPADPPAALRSALLTIPGRRS
ncbi:hypothetical protein [Actinoplanes sp. NBRC 103695]|uniref:aromatic-ring hydroxylase C-terminal domain-containing protein n=1 Tax=Actinoplanes sp. NBRC 103695 TaxID=3032202 RepID=UPI0024A3183C|nr:hypothetical protein [Actinoplanes sp. NBRC 103695]GLY97487.1 hypothetical protein Acsp02_47410 [Actinoplanes sp. NBRC 103695]